MYAVAASLSATGGEGFRLFCALIWDSESVFNLKTASGSLNSRIALKMSFE